MNQTNGTNINIHVTRIVGGVLVVFDTESVFSSSAMHVQCMNVAQNASPPVYILMYNYTESLFHVIRAGVKWVESSGSYCQ